MTPLLYALALVLALLLAWWGVRSRATHHVDAHASDNLDTIAAWPPQHTRVLTTAERQAYDLLRSALPAHMILAQVPLQRFIKVPTRNSYAEWLRRVGHLSADLVVCDRLSQVVAVIEVQAGDEVLSERAQRRRLRLTRVLEAAQIPVHVWSPTAWPSVSAAREAIAPEALTPEVATDVPPPAQRSLPGRPVILPSPEARGAPADEGAEVREPPPSTWFDDFDSAPTPLSVELPKGTEAPKGRAAR